MDYAHLTTYIIFVFLWMSSPGPCFAMVARNSMRYGVKAGIWTASGMVLCDAIFISFAVVGVAEVLSNYPKLLNAGKMIGAAYIFYIGVEIFLSTFKKQTDDASDAGATENTPKRLFIRGFLTDASNPLLIIGMLAIVLRFIDPNAGAGITALYAAIVPITTIYVTYGLAFLFGNVITRRIVTPYRKWFDRLSGIAISFLAVLMIIE